MYAHDRPVKRYVGFALATLILAVRRPAWCWRSRRAFGRFVVGGYHGGGV